MFRTLSKSLLLLVSTGIVICGIYPLALWLVGKTFFPFQAEGSMLSGADGKLVGSKLIAQPFTKDEYFQPRPSAASYDASASASSALASSNYLLRDRIARLIGSEVKYRNGSKDGLLVGADIENWFAQDNFDGKPHLVAQWATSHNALAAGWVNADPSHTAYVDNWIVAHPAAVRQFMEDNPNISTPKAADLAVVFFQNLSQEHPGKFPIKTETAIILSNKGADIQKIFFDMWRQEHPDADLQTLPGDYVTTSGSGLDPHITLQNAKYQLERVASAWATNLKRNPEALNNEIKMILQEKSCAPFGGLIGEELVNVLEVNLELRKRYGATSS